MKYIASVQTPQPLKVNGKPRLVAAYPPMKHFIRSDECHRKNSHTHFFQTVNVYSSERWVRPRSPNKNGATLYLLRGASFWTRKSLSNQLTGKLLLFKSLPLPDMLMLCSPKLALE